MFCPKCGLEHASESVHYCSRCGFKMNSANEAPARRLFAIAMFLILAMFAFFGWGSMTAGPGYGAARVIATFIAAISFYLLFLSDLKRISHKLFSRTREQAEQVTSATYESGLPPAQSTPVPAAVSRRINTAEMVQPPSITEQTTTLLGKGKG